jgi:hypothetical protein
MPNNQSRKDKKERCQNKVGDEIIDPDGNRYVVAKIYEQETRWDLDVINKDTGEHGSFYIRK